MRYAAGVLTGILLAAVAAAAWWVATGKGTDPKATKPAPPASVPKLVKEEELNTITLKPEARDRLAIQAIAVEKRPMRRARLYGGEIAIPAGKNVVIAAPLSGILQQPAGAIPAAGGRVKKGQVLFQLLPLLSPEARTTLASARVDADGQVKNAQAQLDAAKVARDRAERLLRDQAGSRRNLDEAQAQQELAAKALEAAEARRALLDRALGEFAKGTGAAMDIESPQDGLLRTLSALPGQIVPAGATLFEVMDLDLVWVRVPVYVGDLAEVAQTEEARVGSLAESGAVGKVARPVAAPPSASAAAATVDLYYEVPNRTAEFTPGQRVGVTLPLRGEAESLSVPTSAIVYDVQGGTWVYEEKAERVYTRRRVLLQYVLGDRAALASGPPAGSKVVAAGAQELFGAETGFSK